VAERLRILTTGATGAIGRRVVRDRLARGDAVVVLSRRPDHARRLFAAGANPRVQVEHADVAAPGRWQRLLSEVDAVVHLAGAGIADRRWSRERREEIRRSRVESTYHLAFAIAESATPPRVFLCASGTSRYPTRSPGTLDEDAPPGSGFLAEVCEAWEAQALGAASGRVRVVPLRIGVVLDREGGAVERLLPWWRRRIDPAAPPPGSFVPWVHWQDLCAIVEATLRDPRLEGPVNAVAPRPLDRAAWRRGIAGGVGAAPLVSVPRSLLRCVVGGLADATGHAATILPRRLGAIGLRFRHADPAGALTAAIAGDAVPGRSTPPDEAAATTTLPAWPAGDPIEEATR
jgi:uncharacterized protein (TIGR01777 family)